jgi:hypothetical protein
VSSRSSRTVNLYMDCLPWNNGWSTSSSLNILESFIIYGHILPQLYMGYNVSEAMRNLPSCDGLYHPFGIFKMVPGVYTQICTSSAHSMFIQDPSVQCHVMFFSNIKSEFMAIFAPLRCPGEHCAKNMRQDQRAPSLKNTIILCWLFHGVTPKLITISGWWF